MSSLCSRCGATLAAGALTCPFCATPTPYGEAVQVRTNAEERARHEQDAAAQQRAQAAARSELDRTAQSALLWAIASVVFSCVPLLALVPLFRYGKARTLAAQAKLPVPAKATAALGLALISIASGTLFIAWALVRADSMEKAAAARIADLDKQSAAGAQAPLLTQPTACALAESYMLANSYEGNSGYNFTRFECNGRLAASGDSAQLDDFRFGDQNSSDKRYDTRVCFKHGAKWFVSAVGQASCSDTPASASAAGSASAGHGKSGKREK